MQPKDFSEKNIRRMGVLELQERQRFLKRELHNLRKGNEYLAHCRKNASPNQLRQNGPEWRSFQKANNLAINNYTSWLAFVSNELARRQREHEESKTTQTPNLESEVHEALRQLKQHHPEVAFTLTAKPMAASDSAT